MPRPTRLRLAVATTVAAGTVALAASAASAHVSFDKTSVPASSTQAVQARVPVEDFTDPTTFNDGVRVRLPQSFNAVSCVTPVGWECQIEDRREGDYIIWSRDAGTGPIDLLDFTIDTPAQIGRYAIPVDQSKSNGDLVSWENAEGEDHPAPILEVTPAGTDAQENADEGETHDEGSGGDDNAPAQQPPAPTTTTTAPPSTAGQPAPTARRTSPVAPAPAIETASVASANSQPQVRPAAIDNAESAAPQLPAIVSVPSPADDSSSTPVLPIVLLVIGAAGAGAVVWQRRHTPEPVLVQDS